MRLVFFSTYLKIDVNFRNAMKFVEKVLVSYIIAFELVAQNSHYNDEKTCLQHSVLTFNPKTSDPEKRDIFQFNSSLIDQSKR